MTFKYLLKFLAVGMITASTVSCDKQEDGSNQKREEVPTKMFVTNIGTNGGRVQYPAATSTRATIGSNGYAAPSLSISYEEFEGKKNMYVGIPSMSKIATVSRFINNSDECGEGNVGVFKTEGVDARLQLHCELPENAATENPATWIAMDGNLVGDKLVFEGEWSPNKSLKAIKEGEKDEARHLPLMTPQLDFNSVFDCEAFAKERVICNPRGVMLGIALVNRLGADVEVTGIHFPKNNGVFLEGSFNTKKWLPATGERKSCMVFEGKNEDFVYPVSNATYKDFSTLNGDKNQLPLINVWAFPNEANQKLRFYVDYRFNGGNYKSSKVEIDLSNSPLKEGMSYRVPVKLQPLTPLTFLGDFDVNAEENGLINEGKNATDYSKVAFLTQEEAMQFWAKNEDKPFLSHYRFPTPADWYSILPKHQTLLYFSGEVGPTKFPSPYTGKGEPYTWKDTIDECSLDAVDIIKASVNNKEFTKVTSVWNRVGKIVYAKRFINTEFESAWRYECQSTPNNQRVLVIKAKFLGRKSSATIDEISNDSYFNGPIVEERILPSYGAIIKGKHEYGLSKGYRLCQRVPGDIMPYARWQHDKGGVHRAATSKSKYNLRVFNKY